MTLKELVKGKKVQFKFYRDGELWYATDDGFEFPVLIADTYYLSAEECPNCVTSDHAYYGRNSGGDWIRTN